MSKDKVYSNSPHAEDDCKQIIQDIVSSVSPGELACVMNMFIRCILSHWNTFLASVLNMVGNNILFCGMNVFVWCEVHLQASGTHFWLLV